MRFEVVDRQHPKRSQVEASIRGVYEKTFGAQLTQLPARLVALFDKSDQPLVAAGIRCIEDGFFSENYTSEPLQDSLSQIWKRPVARQQIAEITNLAGCQSGVAMILVQHIVRLLQGQGVCWAVFTATDRLRAMLRRTGVPALDVCAAEASRVANPEVWGSYYHSAPRVVAIHEDMVQLRCSPNSGSVSRASA
ncbi:MAG: thermostable hemolysin [Alphaproteobacteria bacterium]|nr:thermostable hemolysin [Alphaproteobacteria bacterium]